MRDFNQETGERLQVKVLQSRAGFISHSLYFFREHSLSLLTYEKSLFRALQYAGVRVFDYFGQAEGMGHDLIEVIAGPRNFAGVI